MAQLFHFVQTIERINNVKACTVRQKTKEYISTNNSWPLQLSSGDFEICMDMEQNGEFLMEQNDKILKKQNGNPNEAKSV